MPFDQVLSQPSSRSCVARRGLGEDLLERFDNSPESLFMMRLVLVWVAFTAFARAAEFRVEKDIAFAHPNGKPLRLDVYRPTQPADKLRPAVILVHGGGWMYSDKRAM